MPQGYQKGFANERKQVTVVDRGTGKTFTSHTRNVFQRRDWNTLEDEAGQRFFDIEVNLGEIIDGPAAACLERLRSGDLRLDPEERFLLCHFMSVQLVRGVQVREQLRRFVKDLNNDLLRLNATHMTPERWKEIVGEVPTREVLSRMASDPESLGIEPADGLVIQTLLANQNEVAEMLQLRTFTLVEFEQSYLFTGECPFVHITPTGHALEYGIATAERLYLPISPRLALVLSAPWSSWPEGSIKGTAELAKRLNWAMYSYPSNRQLLTHPDAVGHPLPSVFELSANFHWPWGPDPDSSPSSFFYAPGSH